MAGSGAFIELGGNIIESFGGIGLLWFTREQFRQLRAPGGVSAVVCPRPTTPAFSSAFPHSAVAILPTTGSLPVTQGYEIQIDNTGFNPDTNTLN